MKTYNYIKSLFTKILYNDSVFALLNLNIAFLYLGLGLLNFSYATTALFTAIGLYIIGVFRFPKTYKLQPVTIKYVLILSIPVFLSLASTLLSKNPTAGWPMVVSRLPIIAMAFIFLTLLKKEENLRTSILTFIVVATLTVVFTFFKIPQLSWLWNTTEINDPLYTPIQHTFFGTFLVLALLFWIYFYKPKVKWGFFLLISVILIYGVWLSKARLAYLQLGLLLLSHFLYKGNLKEKVVVVTMVVLGIFLVFNQPYMKEKFTKTLNLKEGPRLMIWNNTLEVIKNNDNYLWGMGLGDFYENKYDTYWLKGDIKDTGEFYQGCLGYEPHNQFLDFFLFNGVLGLVFVFAIAYLFYKVVQSQNYFIILLFTLPLLNLFTDSILMRQWGVMLYAVVFSMSISLVIGKRLNQSLPSQ